MGRHLINLSICILFDVVGVHYVIHHVAHHFLNQASLHHLFGHLLHGLIQLRNLDEVVHHLHDLHRQDAARVRQITGDEADILPVAPCRWLCIMWVHDWTAMRVWIGIHALGITLHDISDGLSWSVVAVPFQCTGKALVIRIAPNLLSKPRPGGRIQRLINGIIVCWLCDLPPQVVCLYGKHKLWTC